MTSPHTLPLTQYLDLLDRHGRAALDALSGLQPDAKVPPHGTDALGHAQDHLSTLEIWAWLLEHPESDWRAFEAGPPPSGYAEVLGAIGRVRDRLTRLLVEVGPDLPVDYFGRPGTSHDVARLLAHEAICVAIAAGEARGVPVPALHPEVATDYVDRILVHWSDPGADVHWYPAPAQLLAADSGRSWWVRFSDGEAIAPAEEGPASVTVSAAADDLLRWLEGHPVGSVEVAGERAALRAFRRSLGHRLEPAPRRPWWRRR
ncbi:hypothetical protein [Nocardioides ferulae]|uniref:hypothetical protein n=1 Tax=Nocardioides ferulae TaxID=2340821 RepID=UPI000EB27C66|nr:hypothetical protein [Nocardioides ferulae]